MKKNKFTYFKTAENEDLLSWFRNCWFFVYIFSNSSPYSLYITWIFACNTWLCGCYGNRFVWWYLCNLAMSCWWLGKKFSATVLSLSSVVDVVDEVWLEYELVAFQVTCRDMEKSLTIYGRLKSTDLKQVWLTSVGMKFLLLLVSVLQGCNRLCWLSLFLQSN